MVFLVMCMMYKQKSKAQRCVCGGAGTDHLFLEKEDKLQRGMNELEQDVFNRGYVPQDAPNSIASRWSSDYSHARQKEGAGYLDTVFASDYPTPIRSPCVNQSMNDAFRMQLVSRFAASRS